MNRYLVMSMCLLVSGCGTPETTQHDSSEVVDNSSGTQNNQVSTSPSIPVSTALHWKSKNSEQDATIYVMKDDETGCEYIELDDKTMYPRLGSNGLPKCGTSGN